MNWQEEKDNWPHSDVSRFVRVKRMGWHIQRLGTGPKLLLLHGSGATTHSFEGLIAHLKDHFEILAIDLPGHGFSSRLSQPTLDNVSRAVANLLAQEDFEPQGIVGHSAGAAIAVQMVFDNLAEPALIVSINGAFYPFPGVAKQLFPAFAKMLFLNPLVPRMFAFMAGDKSSVKRLIASTGSSLTQQQMDYYKRALRCRDHVEGTLAMMANWDLEEMESSLARLNLPVLQIIGAEDGTIDPAASRNTEKILKENQRVIIKGTGHLVHEEEPAAVANEIIQFSTQYELLTTHDVLTK